MGKGKTYSGFNSNTAEKLLLDAGAFFKNFNVKTDDFDSAVSAGKLIGATRGGGQFEAKPSVRQIQVDGVKGAAKGLQVIDAWDVKMMANVLEIAPASLKLALAASEMDEDTYNEQGYAEIKAKNYIEIEDYIENITYVSKISGKQKPVIIQIYNTLNVDGLTLSVKDKDEAVIALNFSGSYDPTKLDNPPFAIFYPKE